MIKIFNPSPMNHSSYKHLRGTIIALEGQIGVGKSTFGKSLQQFLKNQQLDVHYFPEYKNICFLDTYIKDMKKYAFAFQITMLSKRIDVYHRALELIKNGSVVILDRSLYGDYVFAWCQFQLNLISPMEWTIYQNMVQQEINIEPNYVFYLHDKMDWSMKNIQQRGIQSEIDGYTLSYLTMIQEAHDRFMPSNSIKICVSSQLLLNEKTKMIENKSIQTILKNLS